MKQIINQNIQPVIYTNENYPLTFAYVMAKSSIINSNNINSLSLSPSVSNLTPNDNFCLPKGLSISVEGPGAVITKAISSLSRNGALVTVTSSSHGLATGATVTITGATPVVFNGTFVITVTGPNTFTYNVSSTGNDTATGTNITWSTTTKTTSTINVESDRLVWITGLGAYITKEAAWIPVPEVTNLLNNSTKIYTTDKNGSYLVFNTKDIADPFNQIKQLTTNQGYLVVSNKAGQIPNYTWYESILQDSSNLNKPSISFVYNECGTDVPVDNTQKVIKLSDIEGTCDSYKKAGAVLKINLNSLNSRYNYRVNFTSDQPGVMFENDELYYSNNKLSTVLINNNIDITSNLNNNMITINVSLYENETLINVDTISIYVDCPEPPVQNLPIVKPRFYLAGD